MVYYVGTYDVQIGETLFDTTVLKSFIDDE